VGDAVFTARRNANCEGHQLFGFRVECTGSHPAWCKPVKPFITAGCADIRLCVFF
jgi:hypothetical protein